MRLFFFFFFLLIGGRAVVGRPFFAGPVHLQELNCSGNESRLEECNFNLNISDACMDRVNTAGVECTLTSKL